MWPAIRTHRCEPVRLGFSGFSRRARANSQDVGEAPSSTSGCSAIGVRPAMGFSLRTSPATRLPLLPHRYVFPALARERLAAPVGPAIPQPHPGQLRHEVKLAGPNVAEGDRSALISGQVDLEEVVGNQPLPRDIKLVDAPVPAPPRRRPDACHPVEGAAVPVPAPRSGSGRPGSRWAATLRKQVFFIHLRLLRG